MNWDDWISCRAPIATCGDHTIESLLLRRNNTGQTRRARLTPKELRALFGQRDVHRPPVGLVRPAASAVAGVRRRAKGRPKGQRSVGPKDGHDASMYL